MRIINGTIIDPVKNELYKADIEINNGKISKIIRDVKEFSEVSDEIIDATGLYIAPGLVDTHVHFRDPGFTYKEDIYSGAEAAKHGGFTQIVLMANTNPKIDNIDSLKYVLDKGKDTGIRIETCANVTMEMKGEKLTNMKELKAAGAVGFTDDGIPLMNEEVVLAALKEAMDLNVPISFHEENPKLISENGINRGEASKHFGIEGSPREAEIDLISRDIELLKKLVSDNKEDLTHCDATNSTKKGPKTVIQHISTKEGVELVREAKKMGLNIYAEATPHHFSLTETDVIKHGTNAKMNPPLRTEEDRKAIIEGLKDGTIDVIATDHAPHSSEEKAKSITEAPSGIVGLETSLSLGIMNLVNTNEISYPQLINLMSTAPCKLYGLEGGEISEMLNADLVIFNPTEKWIVKDLKSKSSNSPFLGQEFTGVIKYTICGGKIVYQE